MHLLHFFTGDDYTAWRYHLCGSLYGLDQLGYSQSVIMHPNRKLQARLERMGITYHILSRHTRKPEIIKQRAFGKWLKSLQGDFALLYGTNSARAFARSLKHTQIPGICFITPGETQPQLPRSIRGLHYSYTPNATNAIHPPVWAQTAGEPVERREMATPARAPVLGIYGRIYDPAPVYPVLGALEALNDHHLWIGGEAGGTAELHSYSRECGIAGRIHFCGETIERDTFLKSIDALLVPPGDAGNSSLIPQAWAHGTPVISAQEPANSPVMNGENGLQLDANASENWQSAIEDLTGDDTGVPKTLIKGGLSDYKTNFRPVDFAEMLRRKFIMTKVTQ